MTGDDYRTTLVPAVDAANAGGRKVRLLLEFGEAYEGLDPSAVAADAGLGVEHFRSFERLAVVSDLDWVRRAIGLFGPLIPGEVRVFPLHESEQARAWVRGEIPMSQARTAAGHANAAARVLRGAARHAAYASGQAAAVAHVAAHELGAAAYAIKAARAAALDGEGECAGRRECRWQRDQLPEAIRELVLDDQRLRNDICWRVFDC